MNSQSQSFLIASQIDSACDRFEAAWAAEQRPSIEDFLGDMADENREVLLQELLLIECEMLARAGLKVNPQTYVDRFPENTTVVLEAMQEFADSQLKTNKRLDDPGKTLAMAMDETQAGGNALQVGEKLGDYLIIGELGRGGMGVVYRAKQLSAGREVALKVIGSSHLQGRTSGQQLELVHRFQTEAQATARLNHPHIVTVYEVGEVRGHHFFSMRYVRGRSLADILADGPLDCRVAARYMLGVTRGVQVAHEHAILHRDLNPRNILIDQASDEPLVADFGLAKMLDSQQNETVAGSVFGSPPYMPPEQVSESSQVREAADIYSLGATLYHMLTGRPPFLAASVAATLYQVLHDLPLRPRELDSSVDRDLDTICLKCLQKDPKERYQTAGDLADDLERYINFQPIQARPLSPIGHFWRWCLRNQMMASVITIAVTLLTISSLFSADAYIKARHALEREAEERQIAAERRDEAMKYLQLISKAVGELVDHVSKDPQLREKGLEELRRSQLEVASRVFNELLKDHPDDPELLAAQGEAFHQRGQILKLLGQIDPAEEAFKSALNIFDTLTKKSGAPNIGWERKLAAMHAELGLLYLRQERIADAQQSFTKSQSLRQDLTQKHPELPYLQVDLAIGLTQQGQMSESQLDLSKASEYYDQARAEFDRLAKLDPKDAMSAEYHAECWLHLGRVYAAGGNLAKAERAYQAGLEILNKLRATKHSDPELLETIATGDNNLADVLIRSARLTQASEAFEQAAAVFRELVQTHPNVGSYLHKLAICNNNLASLHQEMNNLTAAEKQQRLAIDAMESLVKQFPAGIDYIKDLALSKLNLGILLAETDQLPEAETQLSAAQVLIEQLMEDYPHVASLKQELAKCQTSRGKLALADNRFAEAEQLLEGAEILQKQLAKEFPQLPEYSRDLAATLDSLAVAAAYQDRPREAEERLAAATDIYVKLSEIYPDSLEISRDLARCRMREGLLLSEGNQIPQAVQAMDAALEIMEKLCLESPDNDSLSLDLADACFQRGTISADEKAEQRLQRAIELWKKLNEANASPLYLIQQSRAYTILAQYCATQKRWDDALKWQGQSVGVSKLLMEARPGEAFATQAHSLALVHQAEILLSLQRFAEAMADWQKALDLATEENRPEMQIDWARSLATAGQHGSTRDVLEKLNAVQNLGRPLAVDAARVAMLARNAAAQDKELTEAKRTEAQQQLASLALALLKRGLQDPAEPTPAELATQAGLRKAVAADGEFASLHELPDWIALFPALPESKKQP